MVVWDIELLIVQSWNHSRARQRAAWEEQNFWQREVAIGRMSSIRVFLLSSYQTNAFFGHQLAFHIFHFFDNVNKCSIIDICFML